ncbi:hypothetical protein RUND412_005075 [Rhizina undulata]
MVDKAAIDRARAEASLSKNEELRVIVSSRKRKLQELYAVCRHLDQFKDFPSTEIIEQWGKPAFHVEAAERRFLEENDLEKGLFFNETKVPHHSSHVPEPGGLLQQPVPAITAPPPINRFYPYQVPSYTPSPPTPVSEKPVLPLPDEPTPSHEVEFLAQKEEQHEPELENGVLPSPKEASPRSLVDRHEVISDVEMVDKPLTRTPAPQSTVTTPLSVQPSPRETSEVPTPDESAPIVNIGGVSVIQEASTRIPDEKETAVGVHPPPPPPISNHDEDVSMPDSLPSQAVEKEPSPVESFQYPEPEQRVSPSPVPEKEIPDLQESLQKPISEANSPVALNSLPESVVEEVKLPVSPSQEQQLPPHPQLQVITDQENKPSPIRRSKSKEEELSQPDVSSPSSSMDGGEAQSTPGKTVLSSATSPDPNHMLGLEQAEHGGKEHGEQPTTEAVETITEVEVLGEEGTDREMSLSASPEVIQETAKETMPPVAVSEDIVEQPEEETISSPKIPPSELSDSETRVQEEKELYNLPELQAHVPMKETPITTVPVIDEQAPIASPPQTKEPQSPVSTIEHKPVIEKASSPDPSAQLRLEDSLANGRSLSLPESPAKEPPQVAARAPTPEPLTEAEVNPQTPTTEVSNRQSVEEEEDDEEIEDRVQLVGSSEPAPLRSFQVVQPPASPEIAQVAPDVSLLPAEYKGDHMDIDVPDVHPSVEVAREEVVTQQPKVEVEEDTVMQDSHPTETEKREIVSPSIPSISVSVDKGAEELQQAEVDGTENDSVNGFYEKIANISLDRTRTATPVNTTEKGTETSYVGTMVSNEPVSSTTSTATEIPNIVDTITKEPDVAPVAGITEDKIVSIPIPDITKSPLDDAVTFKPTKPVMCPPKLTSKLLETIKEREHKRARLHKVVISSAHHEAAAAEAEAQRLREDQENQGMIVVARRRDQQAASAANRGRSAVFQPGSKIDIMTRYGIADPPPPDYEPKKNSEMFELLYTVMSSSVASADLIARASKTLITSNHQVHYSETQAVKILKRIQELQDTGMWSFRQIPRAMEPRRRKCHWDYLLEEMKWLKVDFKEERKWKIAVARQLAYWALEWHQIGPDKGELVVDRKAWGWVPKGIREERKRKAKRKYIGDDEVEMEMGGEVSHPTPELMESGGTPEDEGDEEYFPKQEEVQSPGMFKFGAGDLGHVQDPPPAALFTLSADETIFAMAPTKAAEDVLNQLPLYEPPKPPPDGIYEDAADSWKLPIIPVSKLATGRIVLENEEGPTQPKSRYDYDVNYAPFADSEEEDEAMNGGSNEVDQFGRFRHKDKTRKPMPLPPEQTNCALFRPEFKPVLQRIHNSHTMKPPTDYALPPLPFFEHRQSSQWTAAEDELLKQFAKEYSYNWALISDLMKLPGDHHSGHERRSSWECFERYLGIEPSPPEFLKSQYYKAVQQRLDYAARAGPHHPISATAVNTNGVGNAHTNGVGSAASSVSGGQSAKRRGTQPIRVERRKDVRHYPMIESMRKLAKKRETSISKQQQSGRVSQMTAMRKAQEQPASSNASQIRTPGYFSNLKHEREVKAMKERQFYAQLQAKGQLPQQGRPQHHPLANGVPIPGQQRVATPGAPGAPAVAAALPNGHPAAARASPNVAHALPNGAVPIPGVHGVPGVPIPGVPMVIRGVPGQLPPGRYTAEQLQQVHQMQMRLKLTQQQQAAQNVQQAQQAQQAAQIPQFSPGSQPRAPIAPSGSPVQGIPAGYAIAQTATPQAVEAMRHQAQQAALGGQNKPGVPTGVAPGGQAGSPRLQNHQLQISQQPGQQQPKAQTPQPQTAVIPTVDQLTIIVQRTYPDYNQEQVAKTVQQQLANYHAQLSHNMAARNPSASSVAATQMMQNMRHQQQNRASQANTGPMMSANGPVGPGAAQVVAAVGATRSATPQQQPQQHQQQQQHLQQQQRAGSAGSPRLPSGQLGPQQGPGQSPRQALAQIAVMQQHSPQPQAQHLGQTQQQ